MNCSLCVCCVHMWCWWEYLSNSNKTQLTSYLTPNTTFTYPQYIYSLFLSFLSTIGMPSRTFSLSTLLKGGRLQVHDIVSRRKLNHWWNHDFRPLPSLRNPCDILVDGIRHLWWRQLLLNTSTRYRHFTRNGSWSSSTFTYPNRVQLIHQPMVVERCLGFTLLVSWSMRKLFCLFHHFFTVDSEPYQFCFDAQPHHHGWVGDCSFCRRLQLQLVQGLHVAWSVSRKLLHSFEFWACDKPDFWS